MDYLHTNQYVLKPTEDVKIVNASFYLSVRFASLMVEERIETLVYDEVNFIAAAGGNLGLFLGFSCFSVLLALMKQIRKLIKK